MKTFEFWFDFGSPASWLAWTQLGDIESSTGAKVRLRPMLLGGVFQATGNHSPATIPAKGRYTFIDFARCAKRFGVPLAHNPHFPINTLVLMRAAVGLQRSGDARFVQYCEDMFRAIWVDALNLNDPAVLGQALVAWGYDPAALLALANDPATKDALKAVTQEAIDRGVFGAPTFFVGDQMFWGQDRIDFVKEELQ